MQTDIKNIGLTERDFDLLVEGLETLPEKGLAGDIAFGLLTSMIARDDEELQAKMKEDIENDRLKREREKAAMKDDIKILQGKLLQFKRYMIENGLLTEAKTIIEGNQ